MATQQVVYRGPAPSVPLQRGSGVVTFERNVPQPIEDEEFVKELLTKANQAYAAGEDGKPVIKKMTVEECAIYGGHFFELVGAPKPGPALTDKEVSG